MSFLSKQSNSFLCSFSLGRKYLAWKAESEMRALQQRYVAVSLELAQLGNDAGIYGSACSILGR